jgi:hypothetical protein
MEGGFRKKAAERRDYFAQGIERLEGATGAAQAAEDARHRVGSRCGVGEETNGFVGRSSGALELRMEGLEALRGRKSTEHIEGAREIGARALEKAPQAGVFRRMKVSLHVFELGQHGEGRTTELGYGDRVGVIGLHLDPPGR